MNLDIKHRLRRTPSRAVWNGYLDLSCLHIAVKERVKTLLREAASTVSTTSVENEAYVAVAEARCDKDGLIVPAPSPLVPAEFDAMVDAESGGVGGDCDDFDCRSPLKCPVGGVTEFLGYESWFKNDCFHNRLQSMVTLFDFRKAVGDKELTELEKSIIKADAALSFRVNERCRTESPVTTNAYAHYHLSSRPLLEPEWRMSELMINAVLIRGTLSVKIRQLLASQTMPYLTLGEDKRSVANWHELDALFVQCDRKLFGTFINPMRKRAKELREAGWWDLYDDIDNIAYEAFELSQQFLADLRSTDRVATCVQTLLEGIRGITGFGGSGFRAKEILVDILDCADIFLSSDELDCVKTMYENTLVIGVGPCRTANFFFNKPFSYHEKTSPETKESWYIPALTYIVKYLKKHWPDKYKHRTHLDVLYELCEYNKWLNAVFGGKGIVYKPTNYLKHGEPKMAQTAANIESFGDLRRAQMRFRDIWQPRRNRTKAVVPRSTAG